MFFLARHIATAIALLGLSHCVENHCRVWSLDDARFARRTLPIVATHPLMAAAVLPRGETIVVSEPAEALRHVQRATAISAAETLPIIRLPLNGEGLFGDDEGWWYTTDVHQQESGGTLFIYAKAGGGAVQKALVGRPHRGLTVSLPLSGAEPRTVLLSNVTLTELEIIEARPSGAQRTWRSPAAGIGRLGGRLHSAEPLPGNRAAIVSLEKHDSRAPTAIVLRILAEERDVAPIILGRLPSAYGLTTAVQEDGTIAIVLASRRATTSVIQAAVVDPAAATNAPLKWIEISPPGAISPEVVATSEGFVVAWLEEGKPFRLHAREIRNGRAGLYPIYVGEAGGSDSHDAFFTIQVTRDELTFLWMDTSAQLVARTYPAPITGFDLVHRLIHLLRCDES
jgi:hypothetical protein